jgi:hypothetical protein
MEAGGSRAVVPWRVRFRAQAPGPLGSELVARAAVTARQVVAARKAKDLGAMSGFESR